MKPPKTIKVWEVKAGNFVRHCYTDYHAEQLAHALRMNGMEVEITTGVLPNDPLTRLMVA